MKNSSKVRKVRSHLVKRGARTKYKNFCVCRLQEKSFAALEFHRPRP